MGQAGNVCLVQIHAWGRQGCSRDAPACSSRSPLPVRGLVATWPSRPPSLIHGGIPQPPKGRTPGRFPGETKLP